jgi:hypothetical protein
LPLLDPTTELAKKKKAAEKKNKKPTPGQSNSATVKSSFSKKSPQED